MMKLNKGIKKYLALAVVLLLSVSFLPTTPVHAADWLAGEWDYRAKITIDSGDIDGVLTDFPVMVYLSASSGINSDDVSFVFDELTADANRKRIAVTTSDGTTECYVEIEKWDDANEQAWLWVEVPSIASGADTDLYLYFDIDHADNDAYVGDTNDEVAENVWDSDFELVYHMRDGADNAHVYDSTNHDLDGAKAAANNPATTDSGEIDGAQDHDGTDDFIDTTSTLEAVFQGDWTLQAWLKPDDGQPAAKMTYFGAQNSAGDIIEIDVGTEGKAYFYYYSDGHGNGATSSVVFPDGATSWTHITNVADSVVAGADGLIIYVNGVKDGDASTAGMVFGDYANTMTPYIGCMHYILDPFSINDYAGLIDEVRLTSDKRTAAEAKADYETGRDHLLDFGIQEGKAPTVTTSAPTNIEETTATIGGNITDTGNGNCSERGVEWDTDSGTPYANDWSEVGSFGAGAYTHGLTALTQGELYYYRAYAINPYGTGYGAEDVFLTKPIEPNTLVATPGTDEIDLTWVKGTGAQKTYIRGKDGSYPANRADGYLVYNDTGASTTDTGLTGGHTYYYRAWSYATEGGEEQYSDNYDFTFGSPNLDLNLWFQPVTIISGASLPDRSTESNTGTITWGANPSGVSISIHSLVAYDGGVSPAEEASPDVGATINPPEDMFPGEAEMESAGPDWLRPTVVDVSETTDTPVSMFWWIGCGVLVLLSVVAVFHFTHNLMLSGVTAGVVVGACIGMRLLPPWFMIIAVCVVGGLIVMERVRSV